MSSTAEKAKLSPAYCSFKSFNTFFDARREDSHGTDVVDRSLMSNFAGSTAGELLAALKYLGMINDKGTPSALYNDYVPAINEVRATLLATAIRESYPYLFKAEGVNIERATSQQVADQFRAQGINGSTLTRAIIFFLAAAKQAGIKVSSNIRAPGTPTKSAKPKMTPAPAPTQLSALSPSALPTLPPDVHVFDIPIPIGRKVSISIPKDFVDADWELFQTMLAAYIGHWKKQTAEMQKSPATEKEDESL